MKYIISFESTHQAIAGKRELDLLNIKSTIIPTPRQISETCGLSILMETEKFETIIHELNKKDLEFNSYLKKEDGNIIKTTCND